MSHLFPTSSPTTPIISQLFQEINLPMTALSNHDSDILKHTVTKAANDANFSLQFN